jgi:hypothetical protein
MGARSRNGILQFCFNICTQQLLNRSANHIFLWLEKFVAQREFFCVEHFPHSAFWLPITSLSAVCSVCQDWNLADFCDCNQPRAFLGLKGKYQNYRDGHPMETSILSQSLLKYFSIVYFYLVIVQRKCLQLNGVDFGVFEN